MTTYLSVETIRQVLSDAYGFGVLSSRDKAWLEFKALCTKLHVSLLRIAQIDVDTTGRTWSIVFWKYDVRRGFRKVLSLSGAYNFKPPTRDGAMG